MCTSAIPAPTRASASCSRGDSPVGGTPRDITYVGANYYQKGHNLKIQGDVLFQSGTADSVDGGRLQAQIDF